LTARQQVPTLAASKPQDTASVGSQLLNLIPRNLRATGKHAPKAFTRERKLSLPKLITFILSITVSGKSQGVDTKSGQFFKPQAGNQRRTARKVR